MTDAKDIVFLDSDIEEKDPDAPVGKQIQFTEKGEVVEKKDDDQFFESYIFSEADFEESDEVAIDEDGEYDPDIPDPEEDPDAPKPQAEPEFIDLGDEDIDDDDVYDEEEEEIEEEEEEIEEIDDVVEVIDADDFEEVEDEEEEEEIEEPGIIFTVPMIKDYVLSMDGDIHPVATLNKDANGENGPVSNNVDVCNMSLTYGKDEVSSLLIRLDEESAAKYMAEHNIEASKFAGSGDYYKILVNDGSFKVEEQLWEIFEASYAYIISKYFKVDEEGNYVAIEEEVEEEVEEEEIVEEEIVEEEEEPIVEEAPVVVPVVEEEPYINFTVPMIKAYVESMDGDIHPVATLNKDANGANGPVSNNVGVCNMALTYGKEDVSSLLIRLDAESAAKYLELHSGEASNFAKSGDYYKLYVNDKSYKEEAELWEIFEASYAYIISKYFKVDEEGNYVAVEEEIVEEEDVELADIKEMTLKESLAIAATVEIASNFSKKSIAKALSDRHGDVVELNERENRTANGLLPLADTHYTFDKDDAKKKVCFTYVYEQENGSVLLLIKTTKDHVKALKNDHPNVVNFSKFPKTKDNDWYSVVLDDSFTQKDVDDMYDEIIGRINGKQAEEEFKEMTLKESLAIAAEQAAKVDFSKKVIAESLKARHQDNVELNERENRTANGLLPLADTHYTFDKDNAKKKVCFTYVYEEENGSVLLLVKTTKDHAKRLSKDHKNVNFSKFPKTKDNDWYSVVLDDSFTQKDVDDMYDEIIGRISGKGATEEAPVEEFKEMTLKESLAIAAEQAVKVDFSKKFIAEDLKARYGQDVEINERENRTANGLLPLADTHYAFEKDNAKKKVCFTYVYEQENGSVLLLVKTSKDHAKRLSKDHKNVNFSKFPKTKDNDWYSIVLDDSFSLQQLQEMYDEIILNISGKKAEAKVEEKPVVKEVKVEEPAPVVEEVKVEEPKKAAPKKKKVTEIDEDSLWSVATIAPKKQKEIKETNKEEKGTDKAATKKSSTKKAAEPVTNKETMAEKKEVKKAAPAKEVKKAEPAKEVKKAEPAKKAAPVKEEVKETIIQDADLAANPNPGKFVIKKTDKGNFVYKLFSANKRVVAIGAEPYTGLPAAKAGINSVIKNAASAPIEDQTLKTIKEQKCPKWIVFEDKKHEFRLRLIASNGNIVATTNDGYTTKAAAIEGIKAIGRAANGAYIVRNDDLW